MTVEAVREKPARKPRRPRRVEPPTAELELEIFDCPSCGRPRSAEADPCPDCSAQPSATVIEATIEPDATAEAAFAIEPEATIEPGATVEPAEPIVGAESVSRALDVDDGHPDRPVEFRSAVVEAVPDRKTWRPSLPTLPTRPKRPERPERPRRTPLAIGEPDANIFGCPSCARPLATGTARCPDCSTRLIAGVRASRAVTFVGAGMVVGVMIGGGLVGALALVGRPAAVAAVGTSPVTASNAPAASAPVAVVPAASAPVATSTAAPSAPPPTANPGIPAPASSALRQTVLVNQRLATDAAKLTAAMSATKPASVEIARALRLLAADAAFGDRIAPDIAAWSDGTVVSADLADAYAAIGATARAGLASSLGNTRAYLKAGRAMEQVMADLAALDAALRELGAAAGLDLPPLAPAPAAD